MHHNASSVHHTAHHRVHQTSALRHIKGGRLHPTFFPLDTLLKTALYLYELNIPSEARKSFVMLLSQDKRNKNIFVKNVCCLLWCALVPEKCHGRVSLIFCTPPRAGAANQPLTCPRAHRASEPGSVNEPGRGPNLGRRGSPGR